MRRSIMKTIAQLVRNNGMFLPSPCSTHPHLAYRLLYRMLVGLSRTERLRDGIINRHLVRLFLSFRAHISFNLRSRLIIVAYYRL